MTGSLEKFQVLLRELFQFDCADLDFGIYRIMNFKRGVIEKFITQDLPGGVAEELERGALAEQSQAARELKEVAAQIAETLGKEALDADGNLAETYHGTPLGRRYQDLKAKAAGGRGREALESGIFNHLYVFFNRYYQDGDFISKRRYSKRQRYAIPYNGEEVYLYWANQDQYYVKTAEHFHDYTWKAPNGVTVHFKLKQADVEQNNVKGDRRFFLPRARETAWDLPAAAAAQAGEKAAQLIIPFEYRPLTEQEEIAYGKKNQQDAIIAEALTEIPKRLSPKDAGPALAALTAEKRKGSDGQHVSYLEHHLRQYTRRNTSDFFIHKDLKGFLSRELDFYLKNEVLNLDEMETAGEDRAEGWFQIVRAIKAVGGRIIDFLDQIESFQKMLWEKRKFVTETQYCITVGNIDESFHSDMAACEAQWAEWKELFHIDELPKDIFSGDLGTPEGRVAFLKDHPTLVLDTRHFDAGFVDRLLGSVDDLDGKTDGLLIHSENFQALSLLLEKYREKVKCIYIDPPYNTGNDEFIYKDTYQHSSWLSMMLDRIQLSKALLAVEGSHYCQIDTNENMRLSIMLDAIFEFQREIIWDTQVLSGYKTLAENWVRGHETILFHTKSNQHLFNKQKQPHRKEYLDRFDKQDENGRWYFDGRGEILYKDEVIAKGKAVGDVWYDIMSFQQQPTSKERVQFGTQKPEELVERIIRASSNKDDLVMDYFLGSGTTCAAAVMLGRKPIGIEMAPHLFETTIPRLKGVLYGKPTTVSEREQYRGGGILKIIRLESYEDALNNIEFDEESGQQAMQFEDYLFRYMLRWETRASETLLNVEKLARPFSYKLHIHTEGQTRERIADVPETFNYLLGLHVQTRRVYHDGDRRYLVYRGRIDHRQVAVIWRETDLSAAPRGVAAQAGGWTKADLERDKQFVAERKLTEGADEVFVNGDSFIPDARALEPVFKARMFAPVEA